MMAGVTSAPWKARLQRSLAKNKHLPYSKYMQVATVRPDGVTPAVRTVVFRGFLENSDDITFVTDKRSRKVAEIDGHPRSEVCWYFPNTREQYRLTGRLNIVGEDHPSPALLKARKHAWACMSQGGREQFSWPEPRQPTAQAVDDATQEDEEQDQQQQQQQQQQQGDDRQPDRLAQQEKDVQQQGGQQELPSPSSGAQQEQQQQEGQQGKQELVPLPAFCLVVLNVEEVDLLELKGNRRTLYNLGAGGWTETRVNP